ncbi:LLM class flavin-dependent oxidoreductase [Clavibacter lycopersici]|uniref:LLM class flavin-dependent oxidoreductase n=1 Tax=Clavibacter lycopersici TaxID=2301718 RepID=A0A399TF87_9MICO|nr:NtaA/DmoA family FMN-dependent monooxygenase [Clavibacter lycopersici]RIJ53375.1 LLM class flavin-dependent oxidoreductase [Clavibacter lycopersici]RIJ62508.1 LLM class flavin-dependent oxidoreductase [Clavibacter lycopersici]
MTADTPSTPTPQMLLAMQLVGGFGGVPGAWRLPGVPLDSYTDMDAHVRHAQSAERGKIHLLFFADTPALETDLDVQPQRHVIDPVVVMTSIARETSRIGLVATASTTFNEPYNVARQYKAMDVVSHGRIGWNAVTTSNPDAAANFGAQVPPRPEKYARAHEFIQIVEALWGSWEEDALIGDVDAGRYADAAKVRPIDLGGKHVASVGPLPIPPSEQGQPVIFQAGGGQNGLELAGRHADGVYANPFDIPSARAQRDELRAAAVAAGREADDIKVFAGFMPTVGATKREALDRRRFLDESLDLRQRAEYLGHMIGLPLRYEDIDEPVPAELLARAIASPGDPRSARALEVVREGWSLRDVIAHGVIDYHPVVAGTPVEIADFMQEWFEAGACDGFSLSIDGLHDGVDDFVDQVVPILQERGIFHVDYEGATLRENMHAAPRYGRDPRVLSQ